MKTLLAITLTTLLCTTAVNPTIANQPANPDDEPRVEGPAEQAITFATVHVTIDPRGKPLGAYQFELTSDDASFTVVGVEAGDHPAFDHGRPPYFDPVVQQDGTDRLILAEYALPQFDAGQLPTQPVLIAKVGVMFDRPIDADAIQLKLVTAGDAEGNKIEANLSHTLQIPERPE